jgi:hypothetical protein
VRELDGDIHGARSTIARELDGDIHGKRIWQADLGGHSHREEGGARLAMGKEELDRPWGRRRRRPADRGEEGARAAGHGEEGGCAAAHGE